MTTVYDYAKTILLGDVLEDKLLEGSSIDWDKSTSFEALRVKLPGRSGRISLSEEQEKFPKKGALRDKSQRGKALHFFANHELLAIEMMAQALLLFPEASQATQRSLVETITEEQKHFSLYCERMNEFGVEFGDFPLNQFFWSFMGKIEDLETFYNVVSLTFEQANLDFALFYKTIFEELGDEKTADILNIVYTDEIKHVARGRAFLGKSHVKKELPETFFEYFLSLLPSPLTADRAKGIVFDEQGRKKAGLSEEYINSLRDYQSAFKITKRKQWK